MPMAWTRRFSRRKRDCALVLVAVVLAIGDDHEQRRDPRLRSRAPRQRRSSAPADVGAIHRCWIIARPIRSKKMLSRSLVGWASAIDVVANPTRATRSIASGLCCSSALSRRSPAQCATAGYPAPASRPSGPEEDRIPRSNSRLRSAQEHLQPHHGAGQEQDGQQAHLQDERIVTAGRSSREVCDRLSSPRPRRTLCCGRAANDAAATTGRQAATPPSGDGAPASCRPLFRTA